VGLLNLIYGTEKARKINGQGTLKILDFSKPVGETGST
jgi:hypothetical protein